MCENISSLNVRSFERPIVLVGAGKMGASLLSGWLAAGLDPNLTHVVEPSPSQALLELSQDRGCAVTASWPNVKNPFVILAVKPQVIEAVLADISPEVFKGALVLSVMAGIPIAALKSMVPLAEEVVRAMPNLPASIGKGATAVVAEELSSESQNIVHHLLSVSGHVEWLENESLIDVATAVSGSGPAYFLYLVECLAHAGVAHGLRPDVAERLAEATLSGTGELLAQAKRPAGALRRDVTSPGGTTEAGLEVLFENEALAKLVSGVVDAAAARSRKLSLGRT
ncbi:pyrroline-5-carboxylate reductase [Neorhizobium sp. S3-V5DH]|uniref:pyrroline-5-carboxylate reductase n=1 Tax=Neorhizobium sp. S3-V5DH TaxID=2485166 RepID=UPI001043E878|nr:pyrroline-5-carboxylate reductase [Neorhizobium sp. S3-V5DH]TCV69318.1 pyrroline-5-carboxylate reductase [Neorhizobium sp. S3-V5DH]